MLSLDCVTAELRNPQPRIMKMIAKPALPDEVADCLADGDHGRLQVGHGVAVLALLVQDDQLAHLHTTGQLVTVVTGDIAIIIASMDW